MEIGTVVTVLGSGFGGAIILELLRQIAKWRTGRLAAEQTAFQQRDAAMRDRDAEAKRRRILEEYAHTLRRAWHLATGTPYDDMPVWPPSNTTK